MRRDTGWRQTLFCFLTVFPCRSFSWSLLRRCSSPFQRVAWLPYIFHAHSANLSHFHSPQPFQQQILPLQTNTTAATLLPYSMSCLNQVQHPEDTRRLVCSFSDTFKPCQLRKQQKLCLTDQTHLTGRTRPSKPVSDPCNFVLAIFVIISTMGVPASLCYTYGRRPISQPLKCQGLNLAACRRLAEDSFCTLKCKTPVWFLYESAALAKILCNLAEKDKNSHSFHRSYCRALT